MFNMGTWWGHENDMAKLTDQLIKNLEAPATGYLITYDDEISGFGIRVTAAGARSFILRYRLNRIARKYTIGTYGRDQWTLAAARKRAGELRKMLARGEDPLANRTDARNAPTVADLCKRFDEDHLSRKRDSTAVEYRSMIKQYILPALKSLKVADVTYSDVDALHRKITKQGNAYRANRVVAVLSVMFNLALDKWKMRPIAEGNPTKGIERNPESKRKRYLSTEELDKLSAALAEHTDHAAANVVRLLLLTGARKGEVLAMRWSHFDESEGTQAGVNLETGVWVKLASSTKQKAYHSVPLSAPARQLLSELHEAAGEGAEYVFPGRGVEHRVNVKKDWAALCEAADIKSARLHDLRHTYASVLASAGLSLPVIGALLGHSQPQTTARYSHLFDDPLRDATERAGAVITGGKSADVIPMRRGK